MVDDRTLIYQIAISLIPGIGDVQGKKLIAYCGGVEAVFAEKKNNLLKIPGIGKVIVNSLMNKAIFKRAEKEVQFLQQYQLVPLFYMDSAYPARLKHCEDGPIIVYFKGKANLGQRRILSVVGTRMPTAYGKEVCEQVIQGLADQGVLVVSGLAYGIDTIAHRAALAAGLPTIGVLAHGLDQVYPASNRSLAEKMVENGGLITEFLSQTALNRDFFPRRNRIIAGMADATLVVESAMKGGALITADIANSYNRDVFAIPGRITDARSAGCNQLIRANKAALVSNAEDICYLMGWEQSKQSTNIQQKLFAELNEQEKKVFDIIQARHDADIDVIYLTSGIAVSKVAVILLKLEFDGLIRCLPGKRYSVNA